MTDFLDQMAASSRRRAQTLKARHDGEELYSRAKSTSAPPLLELSDRGFDLIAEIKLTSPSEGIFEAGRHDISSRARIYSDAGACAVSVLTEPERFGGHLDHLATVVAEISPLGVPVLAKDFMTDPCQVCEARIAGAGGILLIVRMLADDVAREILRLSLELGMFVLVEAFDGEDLDRAGSLLDELEPGAGKVLVGLNTRDLQSLAVDSERLARLVDDFPGGFPRVAESGMRDAHDAARVAGLGYSMALVGTALMKAAEPGDRVSEMLEAGRKQSAGIGA
ncbi:MAG: indole-3-glycerol phosphate synthase TrpC [Gammaproteobacteria bacterium]